MGRATGERGMWAGPEEGEGHRQAGDCYVVCL